VAAAQPPTAAATVLPAAAPINDSYVINNLHFCTPVQTVTTDIVPPSPGITTASTYGLHHTLANTNQYEICCFTYIDPYAVVARSILQDIFL
jgi:hypothetical protein